MALGVLHINAAGNTGDRLYCNPIPYNLGAPANSPPPSIHSDQTLIGNTSSVLAVGNTTEDVYDEIFSESAWGPSAWEDIHNYYPDFPLTIPQYSPDDGRLWWDYPYDNGNQMGLIKPDVSAPGAGTWSTEIGGGYSEFGGTSGAAPHVAGAAALLLSAFPILTPEYLSAVLQGTAVDRGDAGKDNRYGAGRIDVNAAYTLILTPPAKPTGFYVTGLPGNNPTFHWNNNPEVDVQGYYVYRKLGSGGNWMNISGLITDNTYTDSELIIRFRGDIYFYHVKAVDIINNLSPASKTLSAMGYLQKSIIASSSENTPKEFSLSFNYPNPFNPSTEIQYQLLGESRVTLSVYNLLGQKIRVLANGYQKANYYSVLWDGTNTSGQPVPSGMYIYRLEAVAIDEPETFIQTKKMVLLR